jgi:enamine deaminase RidA (YjgF/YER057c/UK114 family)
MKKRKNISSGTDWEKLAAYSRAVRSGKFVFVSGTTAVDADSSVIGDNEYEQAVFIFKKILSAIEQAGGTKENIVRTRMFVTNIANWKLVTQAHREFFKGINPAATMVEVNKLIAPGLLVEIEADAIIE